MLIQRIFTAHENNRIMKWNSFFLLLFLYTSTLHAKEGMWLPFLLEKMNEKEMISMGMKIKARDIYDVNAGSLKDAVVLFGGGCTGEVVSNQGLVLTNHHCGYGTVQGLSSLQNNYLTQGFFAKNRNEEIPCPGLSVSFIVDIEDVTNRVKMGITASISDVAKDSIIKSNIQKLEKLKKDSSGYEVSIRSFYYDNEYYLFYIEKFNDIRLVAFPPNGIGKFGGDTDNWAWPRHTGDFGLFRIYANASNKPAEYASSNVPFKPRRHFTINARGIKQGDFTMVYGFPGRTQEYLTSDGVAEVMETLDPIRIEIREKRLEIMDASMRSSEANFIKYAAKQARIANYYKKWKGELQGLRINDAVNKKKREEALIRKWIAANPARSKLYAGIIDSLAACYKDQKSNMVMSEYILEAIWGAELVKKSEILMRIGSSLDTMKDMASLAVFQKEMDEFYASIDIDTDYKTARALYEIYRKNIGDEHVTSAAAVDAMYTKSVVCDPKLFSEFLALKDKESMKKIIAQDPMFTAYYYFDALQKTNNKALRQKLAKTNRYYERYMQVIRGYRNNKGVFPDANSTLRVSYGKVEGIPSRPDYGFQTDLDGAVAKHNPKSDEFTMPQRLLDLHNAKDYGRYAIQRGGVKTVPLAFLASNHTTGGNSGSPVINAKGELIGTNFDRIWEGTMSDILFDPKLCRNITLDIRYTLFVIEKFGQAKWIVDEMSVIW